MRSGSREPLAREVGIAPHAVAALVEQAQAEFGEVEAALGGSAQMSETARYVGGRTGAREQGQSDPEAREEFRLACAVTRR